MAKEAKTKTETQAALAVAQGDSVTLAALPGVVQTQVILLAAVRAQRARGPLAGWVQPTIPYRVMTGGLHPPYVLPSTNGVTLLPPPLNHALCRVVSRVQGSLDGI